MNSINTAKIFCGISFEPCKFPCVDIHSATEIFNYFTFSDLTKEDFHALLVQVFGEESDAGNGIFRLKRTNFYQRACKALRKNDFSTLNECAKEFDKILNASQTFKAEKAVFLPE